MEMHTPEEQKFDAFLQKITEKSKSEEGISKIDIKRLIDEIKLLHNLKNKPNTLIAEALHLQASLIRQLRVQGDIKDALGSESYLLVQTALISAKSINLETQDAKNLGLEFEALEKKSKCDVNVKHPLRMAVYRSVHASQETNAYLNLNKAAHYELMVKAIVDIKREIDTNKSTFESIVRCANNSVDLITGGRERVHVWLGEWHGIVEYSANPEKNKKNQTTLIGVIKSKLIGGENFEIRTMNSHSIEFQATTISSPAILPPQNKLTDMPPTLQKATGSSEEEEEPEKRLPTLYLSWTAYERGEYDSLDTGDKDQYYRYQKFAEMYKDRALFKIHNEQLQNKEEHQILQPFKRLYLALGGTFPDVEKTPKKNPVVRERVFYISNTK